MTDKKQDGVYQEMGPNSRGKALADYPGVVRRAPGEAEAYCVRADAYYKQGECDNAIADYTEALRLDPGFVWAYCARADIYAEQGEYARAAADYSEVIRFDPDNAIPYYCRAGAYEEKGAFNKAIADYTEALRLALSPDWADHGPEYEALWDVQPEVCGIYQARARVYCKKGDFKRALSDLGKALELEPGNEEIRKTLRKAEKALLEGAGRGNACSRQ